MHTDIPALVEALIAPLKDLAGRFDLVAQDARLATAANLWVCCLRLAEAEAAATALGAELAAFAAETQVGLRVHHSHAVGLHLARLLARLGQLRPAVEHLGLRFDEAALAGLTAEVNQVRQELQATRSPDPRLFPDQGVIHDLRTTLAPLPTLLADAANQIWQVISGYPERQPKLQWRCPAGMNNVPLASDCGVDYTALRDLLAAGSWQPAHAETQRTMLVAAGKTLRHAEPPPALFIEHILNFPSHDLLTLDALWSLASAGRFGFSTQLRIYQSLGGTDTYDFTIWQAFCYHVGWIRKEPCFHIAAPSGHLPWITSTKVMGLDSHDALVCSLDADEEEHRRFLFGIFFERVAHCLREHAIA